MSLHKFSFEFCRLGCDWEVHYFSDKEIISLSGEILSIIDHFCDVFSRFNPNSTLSKLNQNRTLVVDDEFLQLFELSELFYKATDHIFNPLATPAHFGYTKDFADGEFSVPTSKTPNFNFSEIQRTENKIVLSPGQILDFGGLGKGFLIDGLSATLRGVSNHFMINGGGDVWAEGGKPDGNAWRVAIETPSSESISKIIEVHTGAVATSGTTKKKWGNFHHIIDPFQKKPAQNIPQNLTVVTESTCIADVGATTMICSPKENHEKISKKLKLEYGYFENETFFQSDGFSQFLSGH